MSTPCDIKDYNGNYSCPFCSGPDDYVSCRDYCGQGADEDSYPEEEE